MLLSPEQVAQAQEFIQKTRAGSDGGHSEESVLERAFSLEKENRYVQSPEQAEYLQEAEHVLNFRNHLAAGLSEAAEQNLRFLLPLDRLWLPSQRDTGPAAGLPDFSHAEWREKIHALQEYARGVPDALFIVLIGNMVTEEALPNYKTVLDKIAATGNLTGADNSPWARWSCGWTAEEDRHGNVLRDYLSYSGKANMVEVDRSVMSLLQHGFDPRVGLDPYKLFIYTSFQERATRISHQNTGLSAGKSGDPVLERICGAISGDESRHEAFYKSMMGHVFEADPWGALLAFEKLLRSQVVMPAELMEDREPDLYKHFSLLAQKERVYTTEDYAGIIEHLSAEWKVASRRVSGAAAQAQEFVCELPARLRRTLVPKMEKLLAKLDKRPYAWLGGRRV